MAKVISKGTILKQDIAATLTAVAQIENIGLSGAANETVESRTLDGGASITHTATGYYEPGNLNFDLQYDPALAGHQAITDILVAPAETDWQVTYADTGGTTHDITSSGVGFDVNVDPTDLLKASVSLKLTGDNGFPT